MEKTTTFVETFIEQRLDLAVAANPDIANYPMMSLPQFIQTVVSPTATNIEFNLRFMFDEKAELNSKRGQRTLDYLASLAQAIMDFSHARGGLSWESLAVDEHINNTADSLGSDLMAEGGFTFVTRQYTEVANTYLQNRNDDTARAVLVSFTELTVACFTQLVRFAQYAETTGREDTFPAPVYFDLAVGKVKFKTLGEVTHHQAYVKLLKCAIAETSKINSIAGKPPLPPVVELTPEVLEEITKLSLVQIPIVISEMNEAIVSLKAGNVSPYNFSGFRDDVQDILFTAAGGMGYINIPGLEPKLCFEKICNDVIDVNYLHDVERIIFLFEAMLIDLNALSEDLPKWNGPKGLEVLYGIYYTLFMVTAELGRLYGYSVNSDWEEVCCSNYTKFDSEFEDIGPSCKKYIDKGIVIVPTLSPCGDYYAYIVPYDQCVDGKHYPQGKYLKSHKFQEPVYGRPKMRAIRSTMVG